MKTGDRKIPTNCKTGYKRTFMHKVVKRYDRSVRKCISLCMKRYTRRMISSDWQLGWWIAECTYRQWEYWASDRQELIRM